MTIITDAILNDPEITIPMKEYLLYLLHHEPEDALSEIVLLEALIKEELKDKHLTLPSRTQAAG